VSLSISRAYWNDKKKERKARKISEEKCLVLVAILKSKTLQCQPVYYLLLLLLCPQSTMIKTIFSWNRFHGKKCLEKKQTTFYPPILILIPSSSCHLLSIVAPSPTYCCYVGSTYICIIKQTKNYLFPILQKNTEIFSSPEFSHVEHICLVVEPP
jgi:competence transcription factor ComK